MIIDDKTLDKISILARIHIDDEEREKLKQDMSAVLSWVEKLDEIDTSEVEAIIHMTKEKNRLREDADTHNLPVSDAVKNAKDIHENYFIVPKVIKKENG